MAATNSVRARTGNVSAGTSMFAMVVLEKPLSKVYPEIDMVATPDGKPVAMVHVNTCTSDLDAWVKVFAQLLEAAGANLTKAQLYDMLYFQALEGDADGSTLLALDMAFHDRIYETAANGRLTDAWHGVRSQVRLFQLIRIERDQVDYRDRLVPEHHDLLRLMSRGPSEELARAAEEHVDSARRILVHLLERDPDAPRS